MIDDRTDRNYPLPHANNLLEEDVERLRTALVEIDQDISLVVVGLAAALPAANYTAADALAKLKTVDGSGSGLDADTVDGQHAAAFAAANHTHAGMYAAVDHTHDNLYALIAHSHSGVYAPANHNHDGVYAAIAHTHTGLDAISSLQAHAASTANPHATTAAQVGAIALPANAAQGDLLIRDASAWTRLPAGTAGQVLASGGAGANPAWISANTYTSGRLFFLRG